MSSENHHYSPSSNYASTGRIMFISFVVVFGFIFFLVFLHLYCRYRLLRRYNENRLRQRSRQIDSSPAVPLVVARRGLDNYIIQSLPIIVFSVAEAENKECVVCLSEFEHGEKLRSLPSCCHRFHIECIDKWFKTHASCPLCRSAVEAVPVRKAKGSVALPESSGIGSEVRIEVMEKEELKSPASRMVMLRRFLSMDFRVCGTEGDFERIEGGELRSSMSLPASPRFPAPEL